MNWIGDVDFTCQSTVSSLVQFKLIFLLSFACISSISFSFYVTSLFIRVDFLRIVMLCYFWIGVDVDFTNAEPMRQLGLGSSVESYPERPDKPDCIYYLRTGFCGYGARCRFNHPRDRSLVILISSIVY